MSTAPSLIAPVFAETNPIVAPSLRVAPTTEAKLDHVVTTSDHRITTTDHQVTTFRHPAMGSLRSHSPILDAWRPAVPVLVQAMRLARMRWGSVSGAQEAPLGRQRNGLGAVVGAQLAEDRVDVELHRPLADRPAPARSAWRAAPRRPAAALPARAPSAPARAARRPHRGHQLRGHARLQRRARRPRRSGSRRAISATVAPFSR